LLGPGKHLLGLETDYLEVRCEALILLGWQRGEQAILFVDRATEGVPSASGAAPNEF
jgi:hypothetical protein